MKLVSFFLVAVLCFASETHGQTRVAGYETYAVVAPVDDEAGATPFAEAHCAKNKRFPRFRRMEGLKAIFDCETYKPVAPLPRKSGDVY
jgi:hypothetical protein